MGTTTITNMGRAAAAVPIIEQTMAIERIAIPVIGESFCDHFGRATEFLIDDPDQHLPVEERVRRVVRRVKPGKCESVPHWLKDMGVTRVLAGGIGSVAIYRLGELGIAVTSGLQGADPLAILRLWLENPKTDDATPCSPDVRRIRHCQNGSRKTSHN